MKKLQLQFKNIPIYNKERYYYLYLFQLQITQIEKRILNHKTYIFTIDPILPITKPDNLITQLQHLSINKHCFDKMKSSNIRQLMNVLSDKYFGSQLTSPKNQQLRFHSKNHLQTQQNAQNILSPITNKSNAKFNRISSSHQKRNQNFNFFQRRNTNNINLNNVKKTLSSFQKPAQSRKLEVRNSTLVDNQENYGNNQNGVLKNAYTNKYSHKNLLQNNYQNTASTKNTDSRITKESLAHKTSSNVKKKLFLKQNNYSSNITAKTLCTNNFQYNSIISNSRTSTSKTQQRNQYLGQQNFSSDKDHRDYQQVKEKTQFYLNKCLTLERQNSELKQKISAYEQQFKQQKILVENLKNMMSKRQEQIDRLIEKKLSINSERQMEFNRIQDDNQILKRQLNQVRNILRQQQSLIMELYSKNKHVVVSQHANMAQKFINQSTVSKTVSQNNTNYLPLSYTQNSQSIQKAKNNFTATINIKNNTINKNYPKFSYLNSTQQKQSIEQNCWQEDY